MSKLKLAGIALLAIVALGGGAVYSWTKLKSSPVTPTSTAAPLILAHDPNQMCGWQVKPPVHYKHIIWIWEENKDASQVDNAAPFIDSVASQCASATNIIDNSTKAALPSEPQYAAATSGSNCNVGITTAAESGSGCIIDDGAFGPNNSLTTKSIFQLVSESGGSWKSYQESMPANCSLSDTPPYAYKHNPAAFYTQIADQCKTNDVPIPALDCPTAGSSLCSPPSGALVDDINAGKLPTFAFVTPNLDNDMHDGSIARGDNWLKSYVPLIVAGPNYQSGDTAIFIMWDEGSTTTGEPIIPTVVIAPSIKQGTVVAKASNNIGLLKTTLDTLGIKPYLGCAAGSLASSTIVCKPESSTSLLTDLNL